MPKDHIMGLMRVLVHHTTAEFEQRLVDVAETVTMLLPEADAYPNGRSSMKRVLEHVIHALQSTRSEMSIADGMAETTEHCCNDRLAKCQMESKAAV